jgi:hypothetical protein
VSLILTILSSATYCFLEVVAVPRWDPISDNHRQSGSGERMSSSGQSVSYLDLGGNFVVWAGDGNTISLYGSHFHQVLLVLPLVISGLCLVAFLAIVTWLAYVYLSHKPSRRFLKWYGAGLSSLSMTW